MTVTLSSYCLLSF